MFSQEQMAALTAMMDKQRQNEEAARAALQGQVDALTIQLQVAQTTAQTAQAVGTPVQTEPRRVPDQRLGRPDAFAGTGKHPELDWQDFSFKAIAYFGLESALSTQGLMEMDKPGAPEQALGMYAVEEQDAAKRIYFGLVMLTKHHALRIVRQVRDNNGYEAFRRLSVRYNPQSGGRNLGRLGHILKPDLAGDVNTLLDRLVSWEQEIHDYESASSEALGNSVKVSVLMQHVPEPARVHLSLNVKDGTTYAEVRRILDGFLTASRDWTTAPTIGAAPGTPAAAGGHAPMEVDALKGGMGKGKGKDPWTQNDPWKKG